MSVIAANDFDRTIGSGIVPLSTNKPSSYHVPGLFVSDHEAVVPLDWRSVDIHDTAQVKRAIDRSHVTIFYREVCLPQNEHKDMPLLIFLQGGPGGKSPRPLNPSSDGWIAHAIKYFRVILPDQRGTGRSSAVDGRVITRIGHDGFDGLTGPKAQAAYLHRFFADSIIRDFEWIRLTAFHGKKWVTEGQSYGGFLTLTYLSLFPEALIASFTTGGIPAVPANPHELYAHTMTKVRMKVQQYYERYPQDAARLARIADQLSQGDVRLPNGDSFSIARLQSLGSGFGMKPGFERVHWLLDDAFNADGSLSTAFLSGVLASTSSYGDELYWTLQEGIYEDGGDSGTCQPCDWAAESEIARHGGLFSPDHRPLMLTGEMARHWMFEEDSSLKPFAAAEDILMSDTSWGKLYDIKQLRANTVPLQAAVYQEDMYVPSELSLRTLSSIGNAHAWVTNSFQHDGVHGDFVWQHLYDLASARGDLASIGL